jgi:arginine N-succinyltransferase
VFVVRSAVDDDVPALLRLARTVHSSNLPPDPVALRDRVEWSSECFAGRSGGDPAVYMFVLEDTTAGRVAGTSSLVTGKGTADRPRLFLRVRKREHYSRDLQAGQVQMTLQLGRDASGPTELGGLVIASSWRGSPHRLGSLLSKMRFAYIGSFPDRFDHRLIGEIMGDLTADGRTMLWDHLGRRFINLSYVEADAFSRTSKEFIMSLFPEGEIYASLLPAEARRLIGRVAPAAVPAMRMLERQGFRRCDEVDPFDGGPNLEAERDEVPLVRQTIQCAVDGLVEDVAEGSSCFVTSGAGGGFRGIRASVERPDGGGVVLARADAELLGVSKGDEVGVTPESAGQPE